MKSITTIVSLLALAPSALALGTCHNGQRYCGSWLTSADGYSDADLKAVHHGPNVHPYPPPEGKWRSSLYLCGRSNSIEFIEYCWDGCHETGGSGSIDVCEFGY